MKSYKLIFLYTSFAVLATCANLASQRICLNFNETTLGFIFAVIVGTAVGLIVKYVLDKRWIFYDTASGVKEHSRKFTLYTVMGVITTSIFWGLETVFWFVWQTELMRELGAILGLSIGYVIKYNLDRRFVFTSANVTNGGFP